jgi:hypothetical protein
VASVGKPEHFIVERLDPQLDDVRDDTAGGCPVFLSLI